MLAFATAGIPPVSSCTCLAGVLAAATGRVAVAHTPSASVFINDRRLDCHFESPLSMVFHSARPDAFITFYILV